MAESMSRALERGARSCVEEMNSLCEDDGDEVDIIRKRASTVGVEDLRSSDGYLFCAPENLASTSGEMLEFFHRCYYPLFDVSDVNNPSSTKYNEISSILGRPYGIAVAAGSDGSAAANQMKRICTGWRLAPVQEPIVIQNGLTQSAGNILRKKDCSDKAIEQCEELGGLLAATLLL